MLLLPLGGRLIIKFISLKSLNAFKINFQQCIIVLSIFFYNFAADVKKKRFTSEKNRSLKIIRHGLSPLKSSFTFRLKSDLYIGTLKIKP